MSHAEKDKELTQLEKEIENPWMHHIGYGYVVVKHSGS